MITILDILIPPEKGRLCLVLSRMPTFWFDRSGDILTACDEPFYYCLVRADIRKKPPLYFEKVTLTDGSQIVPVDWWPQKYPGADLLSVAINTPDQLRKGYYWYPGWIQKRALIDYLSIDSPNPDYNAWR